jgi:hypothetical protein
MRYLLLICLLLAGDAEALDPPQEGGPGKLAYMSALLYAPDSVDAMSMRCSPTAAARNTLREVECVFSQLLVTKAASPSPQEIAEGEAALRERYAGDAGLAKARASCRNALAYLDEVQAVTREPFKLAYLERERAAYNRVCACSTTECVVAAMRDVLVERNACSITHTRFERVFKRESKNKWVSVSGPNGICGIVLTLVISYDPKEENWTYTQTRVVTSDDATCKEFASTTVAYSHHRYMRPALMDCEVIKTLLP